MDKSLVRTERMNVVEREEITRLLYSTTFFLHLVLLLNVIMFTVLIAREMA